MDPFSLCDWFVAFWISSVVVSANPADVSRQTSALVTDRDTTVVVLQPGYRPWLGFFDQMRRADVFVYYDGVQYDKHGWRNRNRIKTQSGPLWLTVPVRHGGREGGPR